MELLAYLVEIFPTVGFPIICCGVMAFFIYKIYQDTVKDKEDIVKTNAENMAAVQARCQEREDKLYQQIEKQNEINAGFAEIIAKYDVKLEEIRDDVATIKTDVAVLMNK